MRAALTTVAWAVPPSMTEARTRPQHLVRELERLGGVDPGATRLPTGRAAGSLRAGLLAPGTALRGADPATTAILAPGFVPFGPRRPRWIDLYDDWSLAPDINPYSRRTAQLAYELIRSGRVRPELLTVNSEYMARLVAPAPAVIVPNGADPALAELPTGGDARRRVILLGHFFSGRTDFDLVRRVAGHQSIEHVVIGSPGESREMTAVIEELRRAGHAEVEVADWLSPEQLAALAGPRTVGVIPHVVSDYTLSQDPMKLSTFLGLGVRVLMPRLLAPAWADLAYLYLAGAGDRLEEHLADWLDAPVATVDRAAIAEHGSWAARATTIAELLDR